jgi:hypothetical protein
MNQRWITQMVPVRLRIEFAVHADPGLVLSHLTEWGCEVVPSSESDRIFTVVVRRISKLRGIKQELATWARRGEFQWSEEADGSS